MFLNRFISTRKIVKGCVLVCTFLIFVASLLQVVVFVFSCIETINILQGSNYNNGPVRLILSMVGFSIYSFSCVCGISIFRNSSSEDVVGEQYKGICHTCSNILILLFFFLNSVTYIVDIKYQTVDPIWFDYKYVMFVMFVLLVLSIMCCGLCVMMSFLNLHLESSREGSERISVLMQYLIYRYMGRLFLNPCVLCCDLCLICSGDENEEILDSDEELEMDDEENFTSQEEVSAKLKSSISGNSNSASDWNEENFGSFTSSSLSESDF